MSRKSFLLSINLKSVDMFICNIIMVARRNSEDLPSAVCEAFREFSFNPSQYDLNAWFLFILANCRFFVFVMT